MVDKSQFGSAGQDSGKTTPMQCAACEAVLTDALDGLLNETEQAAFDQHVAGCANCSQMVADARRGLAWLDMLKVSRPEAPAGLVEKILAQTSGKAGAATMPFGSLQSPVMSGAAMPTMYANAYPAVYRGQTAVPVYGRKAPLWQRVNLVAIRHTLLQPRLAMTAAMAFFSISLTMNLLGVRLADLKSVDLRPSSLRRQFYETNAHVVRYYDNLRVVYELESRVQELRRVTDAEPRVNNEPMQENQPEAPKKKNEQKQANPGDGTSLRQTQSNTHTAGTDNKQPELKEKSVPRDGYFQGGSVVEAAYQFQGNKAEASCSNRQRTDKAETAWCAAARSDEIILVQTGVSERGAPERKLA
ncbi:MAG: anti-sigma factor family protein [Acidobacteriaceae bacterium]